MRVGKLGGRIGLMLAVVSALGGCHRREAGHAPAARPPTVAGVWSARDALQGPMAVWGPAGTDGVLTVTCLQRPSRTLLVTLFGSPSGPPLQGDLLVHVDGQTLRAPLSSKESSSAEARLAAGDGLIARLESARDLRFEAPSVPAAGGDTGRPDATAKRVFAACR